jgi:hypothetical protein
VVDHGSFAHPLQLISHYSLRSLPQWPFGVQTQSFLDLLNIASLATNALEEFLDSSPPYHHSDVGTSLLSRALFPPLYILIRPYTLCDKTTSEIRGTSPQDQSGDSRRSKNTTNTHMKHIKSGLK